jgi:HD-like signal output (HDOD) protein
MATMLVSSLGIKRASDQPVERKPLDLGVLKQLFPIRDLETDVLETFALNRTSEVIAQGSVLFRRGERIDCVMYLLSGSVAVKPANAMSFRIESGTTRANLPLSSGDKHTTTMVALTDIQVLRICPRILMQYEAKEAVSEVVIDRNDPAIPPVVRNSALFQAFSHFFGDGDIDVLPLPGIGNWVHQALDQGSSKRELGRMLAWDPVLAGKLVHLANNPLYFARRDVRSCRDAIAVVGSESTQRLLINCCVKKTCTVENPTVGNLLRQFWKRSVYRAAVCQVLAAECGIDPEEARFAGLIADIGALPLLAFADKFPESRWTVDEVELALPFIRSAVGTTILKRWNLPQELIDIAAMSQNWFSDREPAITVGDLVILGNLLVTIGQVNHQYQPSIHSVPAWKKFGDGKLTPEYAMQVLHTAKTMLTSLGLESFDPIQF